MIDFDYARADECPCHSGAGTGERRHRRARARPPARRCSPAADGSSSRSRCHRATPRRRSPPPVARSARRSSRCSARTAPPGTARRSCRRTRRSRRSSLERRRRPLVACNVDLTEAAPAGSAATSPRASSTRSRDAAGLTLHVRLIDGEDSGTCSRRSSRRSARRCLKLAQDDIAEADVHRAKTLRGRFAARPIPRQERHGREGDRSHRSRAGAVPGRAVQPGVKAGGLVFVAGQLGLQPGETRSPAPGSRSRPSR